MIRLFKLQFLGPLVVFVTTLCAELAARALAYDPSSELLWFVNLRLFGIFQRSYSVLGDAVRISRAFSSLVSLCQSSCWHAMGSSRGEGCRWLWQVT